MKLHQSKPSLRQVLLPMTHVINNRDIFGVILGLYWDNGK